MSTVTIQLTMTQATAINVALDLYSRLCIGQLERVAAMVRDGEIPIGFLSSQEQRLTASLEQRDLIYRKLLECKQILGYPPNGSNGIGHPHVCANAHRAREIYEAIQQAMAVHRNPNPVFPTTDYDGRTVRHTDEPDPIVKIEP